MLSHPRDGLPTRATRAANWRNLKTWVKRDLLKDFLRGLLGILRRNRSVYPFPGTWARDRYGRWELRVPARSLTEPSPDKW